MTVSTIGVFAHANAGKTSLTEGLLYHSGVIQTLGRVDFGNTVTDDLAVEQERGITVRSSYVSFDINDRKIQLLDTPGHIDFSSEVDRAVSVLDGAILVISGVDGIQPQTMAVWKMLRDRKVPTIFFINKLDRPGSSIDNTLKDIKKHLTTNVFLVNRYDSKSDKLTAELNQEDLVDVLSTVDDSITERFLNNEAILLSDIIAKLKKASKLGQVYPVLTGSALNDKGITELMQAIPSFIPEYDVHTNEKGNFSGLVYMVKYEQNKWQSYIKILAGGLELNQSISYENEESIKIKQLIKVDKSKSTPVQSAKAGELVILPSIYLPVGKVIGDSMTEKSSTNYVTPLFTVDIKATDMKKLADALDVLNKEDPYLNVSYNALSKVFSIDLIGELQGEIILRYLKDRFNIQDVSLSETSIIYKETPVKPAKGIASYKSCSQVEISVEPLERGSGLHFVSECSTDSLSLKYQKQAERLLMKHYTQFSLNGWSLTDAKIAITGGKCDSIDSLPLHYNIAVPIAFFRALSKAETRLLEPEMSFELFCDQKKIPTVIKRLSKYSVASFVETKLQQACVSGTAPLSVSKDFPCIFMQLLGGAFSFYQHEVGYVNIHDSTQKKRLVPYIQPTQEELFVASQQGSMMQLDKGLNGSRGKPKTPKRNNSIKKREAMLIRKGLLPKPHLRTRE